MKIDQRCIGGNLEMRCYPLGGIRRKIVLGAFFALLLYIVCDMLYSQLDIMEDNYIIYLSSVILVCYGLFDVLKHGTRISNGFLISWFFFLGMNNLNVSRLQMHKSYVDCYFLFSGAVAFFIITLFFDRLKIKKIIIKQKISTETIANSLLVLTIVLKLAIFFLKGNPLLAAHWGAGRGTLFQVSGLSGLSVITMWLCLLLLPEMKQRYKIVVIIMSILFEGVFALSRNNMMMIVCYITCLSLLKCKYVILGKPFLKSIAVLIVAVSIFSILGNYRQEQRGWSDVEKTIKTLLKSNSDNPYLNWFYGYTAINYDVMLQIMSRTEHHMTSYAITSPIVRIFGGYEGESDFQEKAFHTKGLNGFNASTIFGPMIYEMGYLYIIQVIMLGIQVGGMGWIARCQRSRGHYAYLMSFAALSVFGNFYSIPVYFFISVADILMHATIVNGGWDED